MTKTTIKSLGKPKAYPEPTTEVTLLQTHVSFIFLTDHFAYKVKKPVDFGFLNFTTLDRRRFYCEEEVRLNSRLSPELYLGVVEVRETANGPAFHGEGKVIDYAVKMKRLPEHRMLSALLQQDAVTSKDMQKVAHVIAGFHARAERGPHIDPYGSIQALARNWEENFKQTASFEGITLSKRDLATIRAWVERMLREKSHLFEKRVAEGFIRECDGDIHSGNICLTDRVVIFDCIEFNERFRYSDTASDIAFLLMDLEFSRKPELCSPFLECYLKETGDGDAPLLLDFYKAYRAFIRGKVESLRLKEPEIEPEQKAQAVERARRYFRLCRGYALREKLPPTLVITCGLMGSGKSALARELTFQLGTSLLRGDLVRKGLAFPHPSGSPPAQYGGGLYSPACNRATYAALLDRARESLLVGRSVIVDSTFRRREDREAFRELARGLKAGFLVLQTHCAEELIKQRLLARPNDPQEISDGRWELYPQQKSEFEPPEAGEAISVDCGKPLPQCVDDALEGMGLLP